MGEIVGAAIVAVVSIFGLGSSGAPPAMMRAQR